MPGTQREDRPHLEAVKSCLATSLLRLHRATSTADKDEADFETLFATWQKKWSSRREQIARRLEIIETQLERLEEREAESSPRLAVVGVPADTESNAT